MGSGTDGIRLRKACGATGSMGLMGLMGSTGSAARMQKNEGFILPHENYRELLSYEKAKVVYDVTFAFCRRFLTKGDRTIDQMIQAARSGKLGFTGRDRDCRSRC